MELSSSSSRRQSLSSNLIPHPHLYNLIKDIFIPTPVIMNGHCIWAIDPSVALVTRETLDRVLDPRPGEPRPPTFGPEHGQLSGPLQLSSYTLGPCPQIEVFVRKFEKSQMGETNTVFTGSSGRTYLLPTLQPPTLSVDNLCTLPPA